MWLPDPVRSKSIEDRFARRVSNAILALVSVANPERRAFVEGNLQRLAARNDGALPLLHPEIFLWYFELERRVRKMISEPTRLEQHIATMTDTVSRVEESMTRARRPNSDIAIDLWSRVGSMEGILRAAERHVTEAYRPTTAERIDIVTPSDSLVGHFFAGMEYLRATWPAVYDEINRFVRCAFFFEAQTTVAFTDFKVHGAIFINHGVATGAIAAHEIAEEILHEASHSRLNAELAVSPMFTNDPEQGFATPLRPDPRPMFGAFHQMFVLARLAKFYTLVDRKTGVMARQRTAFGQLERAFDLVDKHAELTPLGKSVVESIRVALPGLAPLNEEAEVSASLS